MNNTVFVCKLGRDAYIYIYNRKIKSHRVIRLSANIVSPFIQTSNGYLCICCRSIKRIIVDYTPDTMGKEKFKLHIYGKEFYLEVLGGNTIFNACQQKNEIK